MGTLRVQVTGTREGHNGEIFSCAYTPDGAFVLSAGWDGCLRLWVASNGQSITTLQAGPKPLSCCTLSPDGSTWLAGSMDGTLSCWDAMSHQLKMNFLAHIRPISAIRYSPDSQLLATASWDRKLMLRKVGKERDGLVLSGHEDIVSGCRFSPNSKQLLSWSHDATLRLWDTDTGRERAQLTGHEDRVTAASMSIDGLWAVSGGRDGIIKLWDLQKRTEVRSIQLNDEIRDCYCLLNGESLVSVGANGRVMLWSLPEFEIQAELGSEIKVMCGDLAPSGTQIALGGEDGHIHFLAIDGIQDAPLFVTPTQTLKSKSGMLGRFLGKPKLEHIYQYTCPSCRNTAEIAALPSQSIPCPNCKRQLRLNSEVRQLSPA